MSRRNLGKQAAAALKYNPDLNYAPVVVASGLGELAKKIINIADENGVPVLIVSTTEDAFISDEEVEHLLDFIRSQGQEMEANEEIITFTENAMKEDEEKDESKGRRASKYDELLPDAVNLVMSTGQASASSLQRRFRVGYTRAARLIDEMEDLSIVGPNIGSKPREILMNSEQAAAVLAECSDS